MGENIGFIGLGRMGSRMCGRLIDADHTLTVCDISEEAVAAMVSRGAKSARTAAEVASKAELVFASLPSPPIVEETALGPSGAVHGSKMKTFVDLSTTGPRVATLVHDALAKKGIASLDAPVSGGIKGAAEGTLAVMVSGPRAAYDRYEEVFKTFGKLFFMGDKPGLGQTMKLANNLMSACAVAITAEGMAMGMKAGIDPQLMIDVLNVSSGMNTATRDKWPRSVLPRTFDYGFATALSFKDARLCLDEAEAMGVPMMVGSAVRQMLSITNNLNGPNSDFTTMAQVVETWAGLNLPDKSKHDK